MPFNLLPIMFAGFGTSKNEGMTVIEDPVTYTMTRITPGTPRLYEKHIKRMIKSRYTFPQPGSPISIVLKEKA